MSTVYYESQEPLQPGVGMPRRTLKRVAIGLAAALATVWAGQLAHEYLTAWRYLETTDDAYVKADSTIVAPKVSGYVSQVLVGDNENVKAGQVLARIDDRDFRTMLEQARADVA